MAKPAQRWTEEKIERLRTAGCGQGIGREYKPWLTVRTVKSIGTSNRLHGRITGRTHHFLSNIERNAFLIYDWSDAVRDIREQFPLDRTATTAITDAMGIAHPRYRGTDVAVVLTTDILLDVIVDGAPVKVARAMKPADKLSGRRTLEKLEIERRYWAAQGVDWGLVTERDLPPTLVRNLDWLAGPWAREAWVDGDAERIARLEAELASCGGVPLGEFCATMDQRLAMAGGTALSLVRRLLGTKRWSADLALSLGDFDRPMTDYRIVSRAPRRASA